MVRNVLASLLLLLLAGCAVEPLHTPSGNPEVTYNADRETVSDVIGSWMAGRGYSLEDQTDRIVRGRKNASDSANLMLGPSDIIMTISIMKAGEGKTKVIANIQLEYQNSLSRSREDFSKGSKDAHVIQAELEKLRSQIEN